MNTPLRPPPMPPVRERASLRRQTDAREERTDRDLLLTMADQVAEMHEELPKLSALVFEHEAKLQSHDRRLDTHGHRLNKLEERTGMRESEGQIPAVPEPRPHADSFSELEDDEPTLNGTPRIRGTHAQVQRYVDTRVQSALDDRKRNDDAAMTQAVRVTFRQGLSTGAKGAIAAGVMGLFTGAFLVFKAYVDKLIKGDHAP